VREAGEKNMENIWSRRALLVLLLVPLLLGSGFAWLDGYGYRMPVSISVGVVGGSYDEVNYIIKVPKSSKMASGFSDVVFALPNDTIAPSVLLNSSSNYARFLVKLPVESNSFYVYYNSSVGRSNDISTYFLFNGFNSSSELNDYKVIYENTSDGAVFNYWKADVENGFAVFRENAPESLNEYHHHLIVSKKNFTITNDYAYLLFSEIAFLPNYSNNGTGDWGGLYFQVGIPAYNGTYGYVLVDNDSSQDYRRLEWYRQFRYWFNKSYITGIHAFYHLSSSVWESNATDVNGNNKSMFNYNLEFNISPTFIAEQLKNDGGLVMEHSVRSKYGENVSWTRSPIKIISYSSYTSYGKSPSGTFLVDYIALAILPKSYSLSVGSEEMRVSKSQMTADILLGSSVLYGILLAVAIALGCFIDKRYMAVAVLILSISLLLAVILI